MKKYLLLALLLLGSVRCYALTASDIIARARVYLKDQSTVNTRQQFSDATMLSFLNDGQREANSIGWLLQSTTTISLTAGTTLYSLPSDFMATQFVLYKNMALPQTSLNQLNADNPGWFSAAAGTPIKYYVYAGNPSRIGFYPAPTTAAASTVTVFYVQQPTELTTTSQTPFNSWPILTPYHSGLVYYLVYRAYSALEETDLAAQYANDWNNFLVLIKTGIMKQPDFNPGAGGKRTQ